MHEFFIFLCLFVIEWVFSAMTKINKYALICDFRGFESHIFFFFFFILQHNLLDSRKKENENSLQSLLKSKINAWRKNEGQRYSYRQ